MYAYVLVWLVSFGATLGVWSFVDHLGDGAVALASQLPPDPPTTQGRRPSNDELRERARGLIQRLVGELEILHNDSEAREWLRTYDDSQDVSSQVTRAYTILQAVHDDSSVAEFLPQDVKRAIYRWLADYRSPRRS